MVWYGRICDCLIADLMHNYLLEEMVAFVQAERTMNIAQIALIRRSCPRVDLLVSIKLILKSM